MKIHQEIVQNMAEIVLVKCIKILLILLTLFKLHFPVYSIWNHSICSFCSCFTCSSESRNASQAQRRQSIRLNATCTLWIAHFKTQECTRQCIAERLLSHVCRACFRPKPCESFCRQKLVHRWTRELPQEHTTQTHQHTRSQSDQSVQIHQQHHPANQRSGGGALRRRLDKLNVTQTQSSLDIETSQLLLLLDNKWCLS